MPLCNIVPLYYVTYKLKTDFETCYTKKNYFLPGEEIIEEIFRSLWMYEIFPQHKEIVNQGNDFLNIRLSKLLGNI